MIVESQPATIKLLKSCRKSSIVECFARSCITPILKRFADAVDIKHFDILLHIYFLHEERQRRQPGIAAYPSRRWGIQFA